jgi:hypothetical protein
VNDIDAERAEAVRRIESRFAHRTVAPVEQGSEPVLGPVVVLGHIVVVLGHIVVRDPVATEIFLHQLVMGAACGIAFGDDHLWSRAVARVEIARQSRLQGEVKAMGRRWPQSGQMTTGENR